MGTVGRHDRDTCAARRLRPFGLPSSLPCADVDLAGDGRGDEGGAVLAKTCSRGGNLVHQTSYLAGLAGGPCDDGPLFVNRRTRQAEIHGGLDVEVLLDGPVG